MSSRVTTKQSLVQRALSITDNIKRDQLFQSIQSKIPSELRGWASRASLSVLQAFVDGMPKDKPNGGGEGPPKNSLSEAMGFGAPRVSAVRREHGRLILPAIPPAVLRETLRAQKGTGVR
jgi:hypothetical protein